MWRLFLLKFVLELSRLRTPQMGAGIGNFHARGINEINGSFKPTAY